MIAPLMVSRWGKVIPSRFLVILGHSCAAKAGHGFWLRHYCACRAGCEKLAPDFLSTRRSAQTREDLIQRMFKLLTHGSAQVHRSSRGFLGLS